jgi:lectin-like protein
LVKPIPQPRAILLLHCSSVLAASAAWLLLAGCGNPDPNLFSSGPAVLIAGGSTGNASSAGSAGQLASGSGSGGQSIIAGASNTDGSGGNGGSFAGCAISCADGGRGGRANSSGGASGQAGEVDADAGSDAGPNECSAFSADAKFLPSTQHCYLVDTELRTFAAAQEHCTMLKAHLVTLSDEAENDFAWSIHAEEHWIGSKDGKAPKQSGAGTYTWITDEPFNYTNWSSDQPNASKTECVESGNDCYEHCAFQWTGGQRDNQWNDRYCMHTIASICEWDRTP